MEKGAFSGRLADLREKKGVSARDMSLSLGQSPGYINNIENGVNYPSMSLFFYICDYLGVSPGEFFDTDTYNPSRIRELIAVANSLNDKQLELLIAVAKEMQ